jgi:hypothetical protein
MTDEKNVIAATALLFNTIEQMLLSAMALGRTPSSQRLSIQRACPQDPKDVEDYDWIGIITGVPRSAGFGQWSAAQDVAASQDAEQESMPARRAGDSSAS